MWICFFGIIFISVDKWIIDYFILNSFNYFIILSITINGRIPRDHPNPYFFSLTLVHRDRNRDGINYFISKYCFLLSTNGVLDVRGVRWSTSGVQVEYEWSILKKKKKVSEETFWVSWNYTIFWRVPYTSTKSLWSLVKYKVSYETSVVVQIKKGFVIISYKFRKKLL
jgi:hypothetical protein